MGTVGCGVGRAPDSPTDESLCLIGRSDARCQIPTIVFLLLRPSLMWGQKSGKWKTARQPTATTNQKPPFVGLGGSWPSLPFSTFCSPPTKSGKRSVFFASSQGRMKKWKTAAAGRRHHHIPPGERRAPLLLLAPSSHHHRPPHQGCRFPLSDFFAHKKRRWPSPRRGGDWLLCRFSSFHFFSHKSWPKTVRTVQQADRSVTSTEGNCCG